MTNLSIDQINILKKYEKQFNQAVYGKYLRAQPQSYYSDLVKVCGEVGIHINLNCPSCVFNAVSKLGNMYFEAVKKSEQQIPVQPADADSSVLSDKPDKSEEPVNTDKPANKTDSKASKKTPDKVKSKSNKTNKRK